MNLLEMKNLMMIQTGNDVEDWSDFSTEALHYLNEGYIRAYKRWMGVYPEALLSADADTPNIPEYAHSAIVDWATWLFYRNGNVNKQSRGLVFKDSAERLLSRMKQNGGMSTEEQATASRFINLYKS